MSESNIAAENVNQPKNSIRDIMPDAGRAGFIGDAACVAELNNISFVQKAGKKAKTYFIKDLNLKLYPGKIAAIASIRSVDYEPLVNMLLRSYETPKFAIESGSWLINGENTCLLKRKKASQILSKSVNIAAPAFGAGVRRHTAKDDMTVKEYISQKFFLTYYSVEELSRNLKTIGFYDIDALFDSKYNTLTPCDKQRLKLCQDLAYPQEVAVLVYPTMSLNSESKYFLQRFLNERMTSGVVKTVLIMDEDLEFIGDTADYIAILEEGRIIESGTQEEIIKNTDSRFVSSMLTKI